MLYEVITVLIPKELGVGQAGAQHALVAGDDIGSALAIIDGHVGDDSYNFV